jgi:hypothetical protein
MAIVLSGSLILSGSLEATGGVTISGSIASASFATTSSYSRNALTSSNAMTASSADTLYVRNNVTALGSITAQTLIVQTVTSSVLFTTGSNIIGSSLSNIQQLTGSVGITGSLSVNTNGTEFQVSAGGVNIGNALTDNHTISGSLRVNANGLFVSSSGNVGIGTILPNLNNFGAALTLVANSGYAAVEVYGSGSTNGGQIDFGSGITRYAAISGEYESATNGYLNIRTLRAGAITNAVRITSAGNVGIGTNSPATALHVYGASQGIARFESTQGEVNIALNNSSASGNLIGTVGANFYFYSGGSERMRITAGGNVGIGSTNPSAKLLVLDSAGTTTNTLLVESAAQTSGHTGYFYSNSAQSGNTLRVYQDGAGSTGPALYVYSDGAYGAVFEKGNVGIGTTTPGYTLEVAGTVYVSNVFAASCKFASYTTDGLFSANARPCYIVSPGGSQTIRFGYNDYGAGQYWGRIGFAATTNWSLGTIDSAGNNFSIGTDFRGTQLYIYTNGNYAFSGSNVSDSRKKANINYITSNQLENILKLKPASFNQKSSDGIINSNTHTGFIAQDVLETEIANLVHGSDEDGYGLDYYGVLALAVKAIQELSAKNTSLEERLLALENAQ